ncbi:MAG TPA: DMT family transporter [Mesorhizobium sp.]|uniref:DMT family transporter n=1 Tax=Mesorhizobium sp. TaxID=1871066 RepID=UPI002DDCC9FD|nr:DMT family transporter [Mesorhizobium sp.]HEV2505736.1 DMT family transporter [Mesorhizobium sp.]
MNMQQSRPPEPAPVAARGASERPFEPLDYGLYALTVIAWSLSWYAIEFQVGTVANEVNIVWRFAIATVLMFGWVVLKRGQLRFALADHMRFVALGVLMFSSNFLLFYYGAGYLVSGLLSVVFSLASVMNMMLGAVVMREKPSPRILLGGLTGFCGIALMFLPEIVGHDLGGGTLVGLAFCVAGTLSFCIGNVISAAGMRKGLPLVSMNAWGMFYGTLWSAILALLMGRTFTVVPTVAYFGSLLFLAVVSTIMGFAAYLTLLGRIGAARAGYATVMFPIFALLVSTVLEDYRWTAFAIAGLALVAIGNVLVVRGGRR